MDGGIRLTDEERNALLTARAASAKELSIVARQFGWAHRR